MPQSCDVARLARHLGIVMAVIVAFVALQTGSACAFPVAERDCADDCADEPADDCDEEHAPAWADEHKSPCPPACADCPGCAGPSSAVLAAVDRAPEPRMRPVVLEGSVIELVPIAHRERVDRPPRA